MRNTEWNQTEYGNINNVLRELYTQSLESCFSVISGRFIYQTGKNKWVHNNNKKDKIAKFFLKKYNFPSQRIILLESYIQ